MRTYNSSKDQTKNEKDVLKKLANDEKFLTLLHGDCRLDNFFFYEELEPLPQPETSMAELEESAEKPDFHHEACVAPKRKVQWFLFPGI